MRNSLLFLLLSFFAVATVSAQVKIGNNPQNIDPSSILELESTDKVLVVTRVTTAQMNAIAPLQGALCYNIDLQSIHYYDGSQWLNIGDGAGGSLTANPIVNTQASIVITPTATGNNIEVAENGIRTEQIVNSSIRGEDLQGNTIGSRELQLNSITRENLSENSVGLVELDHTAIDLDDFNNASGFIRATEIISADPLNVLQIGTDNGAFYDDSVLMNDILDNTSAINAIGIPTLNEVLTENNNALNLSITGLADPTNPADAANKGYVDAQVAAGGSDNQNLILNANTIEIEDGNTIDLTPILTTAGTDDQNLTLSGNTIEIENGNIIDLTPLLAGGGTDDQTATEVVYDNTVSALTATTTQAAIDEIVAAGGSDDQTAIEVAYDNTTSALTATTTQAAIDEIAAAGGSDDQTAIEVAYDNTTSALTATTTQAAIDEIAAAGGSDDQTATEVAYDNTTSALTAITTQAAIDEIVAGVISDEQSIALTDDGTNAINLLNADASINSSVKLDGVSIEAFDNGTDNVIQIKNDGITAEKLDRMGALDQQVLVWVDDAAAPDPEVGAWVPTANESHTGERKNIFFAGADGKPTDTQATTTTKDNGGFFWDGTKRFDTGTLYLGLKGNGNEENPAGSVLESNPRGQSKLVVAEQYDATSGEFSLAFPLQLRNESLVDATGVGVLFAINEDGDPGKGALVFQRGTTESQGDFHFLISQSAKSERPAFDESVFTIEDDGDIRLKKGIDIGGTGTGFGLDNQVLASGGLGNPVKWVQGLPTGTAANQVIKWDNTSSTWVLGTDTSGAPELPDGQIFVGNTSSQATAVPMLGDARISNTGALTIQADAIEDTMLDKTNIPLSGFADPTAAVSMGGFKITNLDEPTADADAATKKYVDDKIASVPTIIAMGKVGLTGALINVTPGITIDNPSAGNYTINLPASLGLTDANYIVNATVFTASGNPVFIRVSDQFPTRFTVKITELTNSNAALPFNSAPFNSDFFFTITDL